MIVVFYEYFHILYFRSLLQLPILYGLQFTTEKRDGTFSRSFQMWCGGLLSHGHSCHISYFIHVSVLSVLIICKPGLWLIYLLTYLDVKLNRYRSILCKLACAKNINPRTRYNSSLISWPGVILLHMDQICPNTSLGRPLSISIGYKRSVCITPSLTKIYRNCLISNTP